MKSKMRKKLIAFMLCMVLVICNSVSILADAPAAATTTTEKQVKETGTAKSEGASEEEQSADDEKDTSEQSDEESAPETETTEKKEEITEATTEDKEDATTEATTKAKEETTEATETSDKDQTTGAEDDSDKKDETSESSEEETDKEKTTEAKDETAVSELKYENDDVVVTVSEVAEGAIPEGAELKVVPILKDDADTQTQYAEVEEQIKNKALETETEIKGFLAYDITFVDEEGNEIEPNSEVKVSIEYKQAAIPAELSEEDVKDTEVSVMHLEEDADGNVSQVVDMGEAGKIDTLETTDAKQVEKVEMKTESFSAYTIIWKVWGREKDRVTVHYVDVNGNSLDDKVTGGSSYQNGDDTQIELADSEYKVTIPGYEYRYSTVATSFESAPESTHIYKLRLSSRFGQNYYIQYQYSTQYGNQWESFENHQAVYMVYGVDSSGGGSTGGGSSATGNLAHEKYVKLNSDGTYDLTLNVTGAVGTETNPAQVDIVFALDLSGSMLGNNITAAKNAANTLIDTLANNRTVDAKWKLVTFNNSATIRTSNWKTSQEMKTLVGEQDAVYDTGTNYEDGLRKSGDAIDTARSEAIKIVVFLTDGQPTYHGVGSIGGGNYTNEDDYQGALEGAATITCDRFYAIGMDLTDNIGWRDGSWPWDDGSQVGPAISGEELLNQVASKVHADTENKYVQNVDENGDLSSVFSDIAGSITRYTASDVLIKDILTEEVDQVAGSQLTVKVTDKNGNDVTKEIQEAGAGLNATYDSDSSSATYKQLKLDFADSYELVQDYTYSVTIKIQPNEAAKKKYIDNDYQYPDTGEEGTGLTSAGKKGIFSNVKNSAKVTWVTNGEEKEGDYNRPVVQIPEGDLPVKAKTEPVNFYLNLSSKILDTDGDITGQENGDFTTSVSGDQSGKNEGQGIGIPINENLVVKLPEDHQHKQTVVGVIGGTSETNAKAVDEKIRELENGTNGNQEGHTDEFYQIIDSSTGEAAFPTDEEIFEYIRENWTTKEEQEEGRKGVNKGKDITVNNTPINKDNLTTKYFAIRWYVFKDQADDCWHIDGILVPKSGVLNITKTFTNEEIANALKNNFMINVNGDFLAGTIVEPNTTIQLKLEDAKEVIKNDNNTVTYTWTLAIFGKNYIISEIGYNADVEDWMYVNTKYIYTDINGNESSRGDTTSAEIKTECQWSDEGEAVQKSQTFAFTNNYDLKTTNLDLVKTSKNSDKPINGAVFKLSQKQKLGDGEAESWTVIAGKIEVSTENLEAELKDLVTGEIYKLEEIQAPEAHALLDEPIYFTVENGIVRLCDKNGIINAGTNEMWKLSSDGTVLTVKNNILYSLPSAGGPGIYWYTLSGTLLMAGAALIVYRQKRKREVLLRK